MPDKTCNECQKTIRGRSDKRFCDDNCRNAYNNRKNSSQDNVLRMINRKLRRNRNILQEYLGEEKMIKVNKFKLLTEGFTLDFHTHTILTNKGQTYFFCYEYGFLEIENGLLLIVKNNKNLKQQKVLNSNT